jgi:hypothetical protein
MGAAASERNSSTARIPPSPPMTQGDIGGVETFEWFSFVLPYIRMFHQKEMNTLRLVVSYQYVQNLQAYPDFRLLIADITSLLNYYPRASDYWEKVNTAIARDLLGRYSMLVSIRITMHVAPTPLDPYSRESTVEVRRVKSGGA